MQSMLIHLILHFTVSFLSMYVLLTDITVAHRTLIASIIGSGTAKVQCSRRKKERPNKTNSGIWLCLGIHQNAQTEGAPKSPLIHQCHFNKNRLVFYASNYRISHSGVAICLTVLGHFMQQYWQQPNFQTVRDGVWLQYSFTQKAKVCPVAHCCNSQKEAIPVINWLAHRWQISV